MTTTTVTIRNAAADGSRPITLNGEVIGNIVSGDSDWTVNYTGPDGSETWFPADSLRAAKVILNRRLGLGPVDNTRRLNSDSAPRTSPYHNHRTS